MLIVRGIAALGVSAVIAAGTLVAVNHNTNEASKTAKDITQQTLDYQREAMKNAQDATKASTADVDVAKAQSDAEELVADANDAAAKAIDSVDDDAAIPAEAQKQLDAAKAQLEQK
jgi:dGTP triphosphohydrolase